MSVVYPGIWGCLQPHPPKVAYVTSAIFPFEVLDRLNLPQPKFTSDSLLRITFYNPTYADNFAISRTAISSGSLVVAIVRWNLSMVDSFAISRTSITSGSLVATIQYATYAYSGDTIRWGQPVILPTSDMFTSINYVSSVVSDTVRWAQPTILGTSSLT